MRTKGGWVGTSSSHLLQVVAQNGVAAGITGRLEALEENDARRAGILVEQFGDQGLERIELAGTRTADRQGHGGVEILFHGAGSEVERAGDATHRPMLAASEAVNFIDLVHAQHRSAYKSGREATPEGCSLQEACWLVESGSTD